MFEWILEDLEQYVPAMASYRADYAEVENRHLLRHMARLRAYGTGVGALDSDVQDCRWATVSLYTVRIRTQEAVAGWSWRVHTYMHHACMWINFCSDNLPCMGFVSRHVVLLDVGWAH